MKANDEHLANGKSKRPPANLTLVGLSPDADPASVKPGELTAMLDWARRGGAVTLAQTAERSAPALRLAYSQTEPQATDVEAVESGDIVAYWHAVRGVDALPFANDLDPVHVARCWPASVMLSVADGGDRIALDRAFARVVRMTRETAARPFRPAIDYSPMVMDWVIGIGRIAARLAKPTSDVEIFPGTRQQVRYRVIGLPFVNGDGVVERVLCHVAPV